MSVIFDALQKSEHLTNQVRKPAIAEGIVTDGIIQKKTIVLSLIALLLIITVVWSFLSNAYSLKSMNETRLTIADKDLSLLIDSEQNHSEVAAIEINENQDDFVKTNSVEQAGVLNNLQQSAAPPMMIVKSTLITGSEIVSQPRLLNFTKNELGELQEVKENTTDNIITTTNGGNSGNASEESVDSVENVSFIVNQIKSVIRSGNTEQLDGLFTRLEQNTSNDSFILLKLRGYSMLIQNNNIEAKSIYEDLLNQYPDDLEVNLNMALLEVRFGQSLQAIARLNRLRAIYPESTEITRYIKTIEVGS